MWLMYQHHLLCQKVCQMAKIKAKVLVLHHSDMSKVRKGSTIMRPQAQIHHLEVVSYFLIYRDSSEHQDMTNKVCNKRLTVIKSKEVKWKLWTLRLIYLQDLYFYKCAWLLCDVIPRLFVIKRRVTSRQVFSEHGNVENFTHLLWPLAVNLCHFEDWSRTYFCYF